MTHDLVLVDIADGVCTITLSRPDARNALDTALCEGRPATPTHG